MGTPIANAQGWIELATLVANYSDVRGAKFRHSATLVLDRQSSKLRFSDASFKPTNEK